MSLRAELIGGTESMPGFALLLPDGWEASDGTFAEARERAEHRIGALSFEARTAARTTLMRMLDVAKAEADRADIIRIFTPTITGPDDVLPVALVASWLPAPRGATAADLGVDLVKRFGAEPLDDGAAILRWPLDQQAVIEGGSVDVSGHGYLLRVPGRPSQALVFRSTILRQAEGAAVPEPAIAVMVALCDAIVASVRWPKNA